MHGLIQSLRHTVRLRLNRLDKRAHIQVLPRHTAHKSALHITWSSASLSLFTSHLSPSAVSGALGVIGTICSLRSIDRSVPRAVPIPGTTEQVHRPLASIPDWWLLQNQRRSDSRGYSPVRSVCARARRFASRLRLNDFSIPAEADIWPGAQRLRAACVLSRSGYQRNAIPNS